MRLDNGFLILYDWLPALDSLSGEDFKALVMALIKRQKDKQEIPKFENNMCNIFAAMIEPAIARRLSGQEGGNKAHENGLNDTMVDTTVDTTVGTNIHREEKIRKEKNRIDNNTLSWSSGEGSEGFEWFWKEYPKKVGKTEAQKEFDKINPDEALLQIMIKAVQCQKFTDQWQRESGRYIPRPATWLARGQWEDELPTTSENITPDDFLVGL